MSTHLDQRLNASKAEVIPDRWIIGGGLYFNKSQPSQTTAAKFNLIPKKKHAHPYGCVCGFAGLGSEAISIATIVVTFYPSGRPPESLPWVSTVNGQYANVSS